MLLLQSLRICLEFSILQVDWVDRFTQLPEQEGRLGEKAGGPGFPPTPASDWGGRGFQSLVPSTVMEGESKEKGRLCLRSLVRWGLL